MRKKNINQIISYKDIKPGDKVIVAGELDIKDIRLGTGSSILGSSAIATVKAPKEGGHDTSWAILETDTVTLLERDVQIEIPANAQVVYWQNDGGEDYYARKLDDGKWQDSEQAGRHSADGLIGDILEGEFGEYKVDSFEVIKYQKPKYASGGIVHGMSFSPTTLGRLAAMHGTRPTMSVVR